MKATSSCVLFAFALLLPLSGIHAAEERSSDPLERIISSAAEPDFIVRHRLLHTLDGNRLHHSADRLLQYLSQPAVPPPGMAANDYHSLRNDIADLLIAHSIAPAELLRISVATIADASGDLIWRDYCIQKLPEMLNAEGVTEHDRKAAAMLIDQLTADSHSGLAGTTLIAAMRLGRTPAAQLAPPTEILAERAIAIARAEGAALPDRITALQIAAIHGHPDTATVALTWLEDRSDTSITMLRVAALAALGELGDPAHYDQILRYRYSADTRLRAAARTALARVEN
ncbi:MAG: hypothetical protein EA353_14420 [Puniceicoccaceae bacterium]|nr:MAG: hypothetical protein EA353_14420 [Puniceicoccaceae bacterium]